MESFGLRSGIGLLGSTPPSTSTTTTPAGNGNSDFHVEFDHCKMALLSLLAKVPSNQSTPKDLTREILNAVSVLERQYPTSEEDVVARLAGKSFLL